MRYLFIASAISLFFACKTPVSGVFGKRTPHEVYTDRITSAGLNTTKLGRSWLEAATQSLAKPNVVTTPYSENGYFPADRPAAVGLRFQGKMGEKLRIALSTVPAAGFTVYMDLWRVDGTELKLLAAADTTSPALEYDVERDQTLLLRLQPALLEGGEYTLNIRSGPSLAYPIKAPGNNHIQSYWGAARDAGARRHEGIDMFAKRGTPVVAAADGVITNVGETSLGGKVVWLRPQGKSYVLYYAHLDEQLVQNGQRVSTGDTLGLMGNTGNARNTAPHLHFGIYGKGGAVDPLAFVNPSVKEPLAIKGTAMAGKGVRIQAVTAKIYNAPKTDTTSFTLQRNTLMHVEAATGNWLRVRLPDMQTGFITSTAVTSLQTPLRSRKVTSASPVWDAPDTSAAKKMTLTAGETVTVLAQYKDFYFIAHPEGGQGWIQ